MDWLIRAFQSSIGKKQIMAVTGLSLCGFLVTHLAGNFFLFGGMEAFDGYAEGLESMPYLLIPAEIALLAIFVTHVALAIRVTLENHRARRSRYQVEGDRGARTPASSTMIISGAFILAFIVIHLLHFKLADRIVIDGYESLYWLVIVTFKNPVNLIWYVVGVCILGAHVFHGVESAFRSLGLCNSRFAPAILWASRAFGVSMAIGYSSLPIYAYCFVDLPAAIAS
jgi:succinate dehydrogenase / fumarate reductase cytochrome b subunit